MASIYLPPIARKKKVEGWPRQDTSRVFSDIEESYKHGSTSYGSDFVRHNIPPTPQRAVSPTRKNKPQPTAVTFLRQNPRFVCEPICHVDTLAPKNEAFCSWWPNELKDHPVIRPKYTYHSTSRADYKNFTSSDSMRCASYSRHKVLTQKATRPEGNIKILPGCSSPHVMPTMPEKISYEHQFNSRLDPSFPIRGRRHGCFVWKASLPFYRTGDNKHLKSKSLRNKKDTNNEMNTTDAVDNSDAKSIISTISEKPKHQDPSSDDKELDTFDLKVKSDAWSSNEPTSNKPSLVTKPPTQTMLEDNMVDFTESKMEDVVTPSKPRRHATPPHLT